VATVSPRVMLRVNDSDATVDLKTFRRITLPPSAPNQTTFNRTASAFLPNAAGVLNCTYKVGMAAERRGFMADGAPGVRPLLAGLGAAPCLVAVFVVG
jgi:hypothetical protein